MPCNGRLMPRVGTIENGMLKALAEDNLDAVLPRRTGAVATALEYTGLWASGDVSRVGIGKAESETSPGDGGGLLLESRRARSG